MKTAVGTAVFYIGQGTKKQAGADDTRLFRAKII
jgi:hypothetical protein